MTARMCELCPQPAVRNGRCARCLQLDEPVIVPKRRKPPPKRKWEPITAHDRIWQRISAAWLAEHPFCESCRMQGRPLVEADCVDHIRPTAWFPELVHDGTNLQSLCSRKPYSCHQRKTAWERKGIALDFARRKRHDISGAMKNPKRKRKAHGP